MSALVLPHATATATAHIGVDAHALGRLAIASLHAELACDPKPGLVTPSSRGSHDDMDAGTFLRSLFALRSYFVDIAAVAPQAQRFDTLRTLGIAAERRMLAATGGINTHRGAIFSLGLLVAQAARLRSEQGRPARAEVLCASVQVWQDALLAAALDPCSPGQRARRAHGVAGVREQAAAGYPLLREVALPELRRALQQRLPRDAALAQTLMALVAVTDDLNLLHRGGKDGLAFARAQACAFLQAGGVHQPQWRSELRRIGDTFQQRRLSPGGSADLLACAWFALQQERP